MHSTPKLSQIFLWVEHSNFEAWRFIVDRSHQLGCERELWPRTDSVDQQLHRHTSARRHDETPKHVESSYIGIEDICEYPDIVANAGRIDEVGSHALQPVVWDDFDAIDTL
ncbi:hypothetical protein WL26_23755 [Burkholderia cepacia]|nr:hypothetical protein WL26_23755 [Burkholderia cepacia]